MQSEKWAVNKLVREWCANYDSDYGCLPLNADCVMVNKVYDTIPCKYFRNAVLPLKRELEAKLTGAAIEKKSCAICKKKFIPESNRQEYCSDFCKKKAKRVANAERAKKYRNSKSERHALEI